MNKKYLIAGIICDAAYFVSVAFYIATKLEWALTVWELMTIIGAAAMLVILDRIAQCCDIGNIRLTYMRIVLSGNLIITAIAHFTSIGVVRKLTSEGVDIPDYFKIGHFPSIEMTLDYIAWGMLMGTAFLIIFSGAKNKAVRTISLICSVLCYIGFIGSFFADFLWYPAPLGYGFGFLVLCLALLKTQREKSQPVK